MNQPRKIVLSDEISAIVEREATRVGKSPEEWLAEILKPFSILRSTNSSLSDEEKEAARLRFEAHFGEIDMPEAVGLDNDQIDADIARGLMDWNEAP